MNKRDDAAKKEENTKTSAFMAPAARLARAYVPWQRYGATYNPQEALEKGTLFPELYRPYPY